MRSRAGRRRRSGPGRRAPASDAAGDQPAHLLATPATTQRTAATPHRRVRNVWCVASTASSAAASIEQSPPRRASCLRSAGWLSARCSASTRHAHDEAAAATTHAATENATLALRRGSKARPPEPVASSALTQTTRRSAQPRPYAAHHRVAIDHGSAVARRGWDGGARRPLLHTCRRRTALSSGRRAPSAACRSRRRVVLDLQSV